MTWLYFSLAAATFESLRDVLSKVVTNKGDQPLDEYVVAWALRAFTLIIYIPWLLLSPNPVPVIGKDFWWALLADATLSTIGGILYIRALRFGDISLTIPLMGFSPLFLAIASLIITWVMAIPLGILAAVKQNRLTDQVLQVVSYAGQGIPNFITVLFLLFFAQLTTPLFPVGNMTSIDHAELTWLGKILDIAWHSILPLIALSVTSFAGLQRIMRGQLLDVLRQDYIQTARAKGLPENRVIYVHALRNAINPLIMLLGFELAGLLSGAFITENFFNWPGLGKLTLQAVLAKDQYLVMASLVMSAVLLILGNLIADLILKAADPRIKLEDLN